MSNTNKKGKPKTSLITWQLALFTMARIAILTVEMLNFCVRNGNRCVHLAIATRSGTLPSPVSLKTE